MRTYTLVAALVPWLALALARPAPDYSQLRLAAAPSSSSPWPASNQLAPPAQHRAPLRPPVAPLSEHGYGERSPLQPLENLQVHHPPLVSKRARRCTLTLLEHSFAFSYCACISSIWSLSLRVRELTLSSSPDEPAVTSFEPPVNCGPPGSWSSVVLNLTVTSNGTQFDRLASISLAHVESAFLSPLTPGVEPRS